jgi:hypothetical protein
MLSRCPRADSESSPGELQRDDWDSHWRAYAESAGRNPAQAFRRRIILRQLSAAGRPRRVLGIGDLAAAVVDRFPGVAVLGLELSAEGIALSRIKAPTADFIQCDLSSPVNQRRDSRAGDHAVCSGVLEHVDDPIALLRHGRVFMASHCLLVVTVPGGPMTAYDRHIGQWRHFRPADLTRVLELERVRGITRRGRRLPVVRRVSTCASRTRRARHRCRRLGPSTARGESGDGGRRGPAQPEHPSRFSRLPDRRGGAPAADAGRSRATNAGVNSFARLVLAICVSLSLGWVAIAALPTELSITTDIVGYPTHAEFNIDRYYWAYAIAVVLVPLAVLAIYLALTRLSTGRFGPWKRALPARARVEEMPAIVGWRVPAVAAGRTLFIRLGARTRARSRTRIAPGQRIGLGSVVRAVVALVSLFLAPVRDPLEVSRAVNMLVAPLAIGGMYLASRETHVVVAQTREVFDHPWLPHGLPSPEPFSCTPSPHYSSSGCVAPGSVARHSNVASGHRPVRAGACASAAGSSSTSRRAWHRVR